jgi:hypothetical protein
MKTSGTSFDDPDFGNGAPAGPTFQKCPPSLSSYNYALAACRAIR